MTSHRNLAELLRVARQTAAAMLPEAADLYVTLDPWGTICCSASQPRQVSITADSLDEFRALLAGQSQAELIA